MKYSLRIMNVFCFERNRCTLVQWFLILTRWDQLQIRCCRNCEIFALNAAYWLQDVILALQSTGCLLGVCFVLVVAVTVEVQVVLVAPTVRDSELRSQRKKSEQDHYDHCERIYFPFFGKICTNFCLHGTSVVEVTVENRQMAVAARMLQHFPHGHHHECTCDHQQF